MKNENEKFFVNLPTGKKNGICEPMCESMGGSVAINIEDNCINCKTGSCMMFKVIIDEGGAILRRVFTKHNPEY